MIPSNAGRLNSIHLRMTLGFALFIGVLMLAVCLAFFSYTKRADRQNADAQLDLAVQEIQRELRVGLQHRAYPTQLAGEEIEELRAAHIAVMVVDQQNRIVARSQRAVPPWPPHGDAWRTRSFSSGIHTIVVGIRWHEIEQRLRERTTVLLALSGLVVAFSALGAWILVGRTLSPIDQLARQAQVASAESLHVQLVAPSPDAEITRLVATLNDLLARLGETAAMRGRFYAAASHELRTPLQALSGHLEVALSRPRLAAEYRAALQEAHDQTERLTSLIQDLLLLNQLDADTSRPTGVSLDMADLCLNELAPLRALAEERDLSIEISLPDACEMVAPWNHATMLLRNLLENAVKYATAGGRISVELTPNLLTICNDCAEIVDWDAQKYFEPFFRPDASRNSQTGGNGLGLAICQAIAHSNQWTLTLTQQGNRMCARVCFHIEP